MDVEILRAIRARRGGRPGQIRAGVSQPGKLHRKQPPRFERVEVRKERTPAAHTAPPNTSKEGAELNLSQERSHETYSLHIPWLFSTSFGIIIFLLMQAIFPIDFPGDLL
ncbi:MAG: hypothetical protein JO252_04470 [Planctomycetaceae bacterium]|nr:hypothetical protein [Planctomycetaceae bacterium]